MSKSAATSARGSVHDPQASGGTYLVGLRDYETALDEIERLRAEREAVDRLVEAVREMLWLVDDGAPEKETVHWRIRDLEAARAK